MHAIACGSSWSRANCRTVWRKRPCSSVGFSSRSSSDDGTMGALYHDVGVERWLHDKPAVLVANPTAQSGRAADWIGTRARTSTK